MKRTSQPKAPGAIPQLRAKEEAEALARERLKSAGYQFADAIRAYEEAAVALMAVDFNRGLTVATWAKALRIKQGEMNLEGA